MEAVDRISVAILYRHQLFGEGIAHFLASEPDVLVQCLPMRAGEASADALPPGADPDVLIFERSDPDAAVELLRAFPDTLVIDVALGTGPTYVWRREVVGPEPDSIVSVIRAFAGSGAADTSGRPVGPGRPHACLVTAGGV